MLALGEDAVVRSRLDSGSLERVIGPGCDLIAHIPQIFVEQMLHALMQDLDRSSHGANHASSDDPLRQL